MTDKLSEVDIPDDLVRRLREVGGFDPVAELCSKAADRIHKLELDLHFQKLQKVEWACYGCVEKNEAATARIEKLEIALKEIHKCKTLYGAQAKAIRALEIEND